MTIELRERSPLGAFVRSPLGVLGQDQPGPASLNGFGFVFNTATDTGQRWFDNGIGGNDDCATDTGTGISTYRITLDCEGTNLLSDPQGQYPDPLDAFRVLITGDTSGDSIDVQIWADTWAGFGQCRYDPSPRHEARYSEEIEIIYRQYNVMSRWKTVARDTGFPATLGLSIEVFCHETPIFPRPAPGRPPAFLAGEQLTVTYVR